MDSNALVQMRVHDVNVLTDLDALNPTSPEPPSDTYLPIDQDSDDIPDPDSTGGATPTGSPECEQAYVAMLSTALGLVTTYWTGFWPLLHFSIEWYVAELGDTMRIAFCVDLLSSLTIEEVHLFTILGYGTGSTIMNGFWETNFNVVVGLTFSLTFAAITVAECVYRTAPFSPWFLVAWGAACVAMIAYFWLTWVLTYEAIRNGQISYLEGADNFYSLFLGILWLITGGVALTGLVATKGLEWALRRLNAQLSEGLRKVVETTVKALIWAKIFVVFCLVVFAVSAVVCYLYSL